MTRELPYYESNSIHLAKNDDEETSFSTTSTSALSSENLMVTCSEGSGMSEEGEAKYSISVGVFKAIKDKRWDDVTSRAAHYPEEASQWVVASVADEQPERLLALHYACSLDAPIEVVKSLVEADSAAVRQSDQNGRTLLHWAADHIDSSSDIFDVILDLHPDSARVREHKYGCTPLHVACCRQQLGRNGEEKASHVIDRLLEAFPEAALCRDQRKGWLPLHVAARNGASPAIIEALTFACPTAAAIGDEDHRLPLHYVARYANSWNEEQLKKVVDTVVACYPAGLKRRERTCGHTPLAIACSTPHQPPVLKAIVSLLLRYGQAAVSIPTFDQSLPIHIASRSRAPFDVMRDLLIANPMSAAEQDKHGRTALHWACQMCAPTEIIEILIRVFPSGAAVTENKYGFTPLACALHRRADTPTISTLLSYCPRAARAKDMHGSLPIHAACKTPTGSIIVNIIEMLTRAYPESARVKDGKGRVPIDLAMKWWDKDESIKASLLHLLGEGRQTSMPAR
uniref:Uncharacterized protein n=1 Tax=Odontella aurita TaxID=265563 RepID=A0A7S4J383_9STRA|mmetsp:Transcript_3716/g.9986  ORF Transcript_3716/g.9986 Transcript_3716/m.9986 type:complete len:513 (+) Transcript_3716:136-1674(+)